MRHRRRSRSALRRLHVAVGVGTFGSRTQWTQPRHRIRHSQSGTPRHRVRNSPILPEKERAGADRDWCVGDSTTAGLTAPDRFRQMAGVGYVVLSILEDECRRLLL